MSNSSLISYTKLSPNCNSPRAYRISGITIHHMAGNLSLETCGNVFANPNACASANYGVSSDGSIALYVDEGDMAWTSSNWYNDNRCVTIEVANDEIGGNWHVSDKALAATIKLCVDICKRNNIPMLNFTGDSSGNLTMHRYFTATLCPGPYLASQFNYIASEVNRQLKSGWRHDDVGWWYEHKDGSYTTNDWEKIDDNWCYFDWRGYAYQSSWLAKTEGYYYLNSACYMATGWIESGGYWYYMDDDTSNDLPHGLMRTGFIKDNGYDYYLRTETSGGYPQGSMATGWFELDGKWYYAMPYSGDTPLGSICKGWLYEGGEWYLLDSNTGEMLTGFQPSGGYLYYLRPENDGEPKGSMVTGWYEIDVDWCYFNDLYNCQPYGSMFKDHWIHLDGADYYIGSSGVLENGDGVSKTDVLDAGAKNTSVK